MRISDWSSDVCSSDLPRPSDNIAGAGDAEIAPVERRTAIGHQQEILLRPKLGAARPPRHRPPRAIACLALRGKPPVDCHARAHRAHLITRRGRNALHQRHVRRKIMPPRRRSEEHTSELQSLMRISYAAFCLTKKK